MSPTQTDMDASVDIFESLLFPYIINDEKYEKAIGEARKRLKNGLLNNIDTAQADFTKEKFRALMCLAERKNLLLDKIDRDEEWNLDDSESECTETDNDMEIQD